MPLAAQTDPAVVVELYTSQGCSSCPPADAHLAELTANPALIPLALHVDYWDYIGWADSFANPKFTERQKAYARAEGSTTIYTPQLIVGGVDRIVGFAPAEVAAQIRQHSGVISPVTLWLSRQGGDVLIRAEAVPALAAPVRVQLVRYLPSSDVRIERGENAGQTITYHNIVTSWTRVGEWAGDEALELRVPAAGNQPIVVILQAEGPGQIVAAGRID